MSEPEINKTEVVVPATKNELTVNADVDTHCDYQSVIAAKNPGVTQQSENVNVTTTPVKKTPQGAISKTIIDMDELMPKALSPRRNCLVVEINNGIFMYGYNLLLHFYNTAIKESALNPKAILNTTKYVSRSFETTALFNIMKCLPNVINPRSSFPIMTNQTTSKAAFRDDSISGCTLLDLATFLTLMNVNQSYSTHINIAKPDLSSPDYFFYVIAYLTYSRYKDQVNFSKSANYLRAVPTSLLDSSKSLQRFSPSDFVAHFGYYADMCDSFARLCLEAVQILSAFVGELDSKMRADPVYNEWTVSGSKADLPYNPYLINTIASHKIPIVTSAPTSMFVTGQMVFDELSTHQSIPETQNHEFSITGSGIIVTELDISKESVSEISSYSFIPRYNKEAITASNFEAMLEYKTVYTYVTRKTETEPTDKFVRTNLLDSYNNIIGLLTQASKDIIHTFPEMMIYVTVPEKYGKVSRNDLIKMLSLQIGLCQYKIKRLPCFKDGTDVRVNVSDEQYFKYAVIDYTGFTRLKPANTMSSVNQDKLFILPDMTADRFKTDFAMRTLPPMPVINLEYDNSEWSGSCSSQLPGSVLHTLATSKRTLVMVDDITIETSHLCDVISNLTDPSLAELVTSIDVTKLGFLYPFFNIYPNLKSEIDPLTYQSRVLSLKASWYIWQLSLLAQDLAIKMIAKILAANWLKSYTFTNN